MNQDWSFDFVAFLPPLESMISLRTTTLLLFFAAYKPTTSAQLVDMNHKQQAECLKSVENYVQNITDTASECEGLMAAYKDGCSPYNDFDDDVILVDDDRDVPLRSYTRHWQRTVPWQKKPIPKAHSTCCQKLINLYHQRCNSSEESELTDRRLISIILMLIVAFFSRSFVKSKKVTWLPEAAACILVGMFGGAIIRYALVDFEFSFDERLFLRILLPPICFEAALSINKSEFRRLIGPILTYAIAGTLISATLTGAFIRFLSVSRINFSNQDLPWPECLAFGALISSIDPVATLAILNNLGVPSTTTHYVVIFGESLLNDGVAVVLFDTITTFMKAEPTLDASDFASATLNFLFVFVGSTLVGFVCGLCCNFYFRFMHGQHRPLVEISLFFLWALLPYYMCDSFGGSGIVAIVVCGVVIDIYSRRHLSVVAKTNVNFVVEIISVTMETAIFCYVGIFIFIAEYKWNFFLCLTALAACLLARALMVIFLTFIVNHSNFCRCSWRIYRNRRHSSRGSLNESFLSDDGGRLSKVGMVDEPSVDAGADAGGGVFRQSNSMLSLISGLSGKNGIGDGTKFVSGKTQFVLWFSGLRGAMSFALVENLLNYDQILDEGTLYKRELRAMVSTCVFVTIFVFGGSTHYVLGKLGIGDPDQGNNDQDYNNSRVRVGLRKSGSSENNLSMGDVTRDLYNISRASSDDLMIADQNDTEVSLLNNNALLSDDGLMDGSPSPKISSLKNNHFR